MNVHYDQKSGIGAVPFNQQIDHMGFKCWMTPDMFLRLVRKITVDPNDQKYQGLKSAIQRGKPIGSPFLDVSWDMVKQVWTVWDQGGRHNVQAVKDLWPSEQLEVHIFPGEGERARDLNPQMLQSFMQGIFAQDKTFVKNPTGKIEWQKQTITPQAQPGQTPPNTPIFETQLQKSQREAKEFEGKTGVRKNFEHFGMVKKDHLTGRSQWIRENKEVVKKIVKFLCEVENPPLEKRLSAGHDKLYKQFQSILNKEKPCQFDTCGNCAGSRAGYVPSKTACCTGCDHHDPEKGCTTQALGCKSWRCSHMAKNMSPEAEIEWKKLQDKMFKANLGGVRATKDQEINYALGDIKQKREREKYNQKRWLQNFLRRHPAKTPIDAWLAYNRNYQKIKMNRSYE